MKKRIELDKIPQSIIAVIPARKASKRFPDKNTALLNGKPLVRRAIDVAVEATIFAKIFVTTDDPKVMAIARETGVDIIDRPKALCTDTVLVDKTALHVIDVLESRGESYEAVCLMTPAAPLRTVDDVTGAFQLFLKKKANFVITVTEYEHSPYYALSERNGVLEPTFMADAFSRERAFLPKLYRPVAVARIGRWEAVKEHGTIFGPGMIPYLIPVEHAVDIDNRVDLEWAEFLLGKLKRT